MLPLLLGAAIVAAVWASHKGPQKASNGATQPQKLGELQTVDVAANASTNEQTDTPADADAGANDPNVEIDVNPNGQNTSATATTTTTETGQSTTETDAGAGTSTTTAPPQQPMVATAPEPQTTDTTEQPAPTFQVASYQEGLAAQYGSTPTKADSTEYYGAQLRGGTVVL